MDAAEWGGMNGWMDGLSLLSLQQQYKYKVWFGLGGGTLVNHSFIQSFIQLHAPCSSFYVGIGEPELNISSTSATPPLFSFLVLPLAL